MEYFGIIAGLGVPELLIILMIIVVLFGSKLLPKLSRSVGESASELRKGFGGNKRKTETATAAAEQQPASATATARAPRI
jgi:sec-independent protein translocase protein TatA